MPTQQERNQTHMADSINLTPSEDGYASIGAAFVASLLGDVRKRGRTRGAHTMRH